jgi:MFS family permease
MPLRQQQRWIILMMLITAHAINDGFAWIIPPLLPAIRDHFHLSYTELGAFYTFSLFLGNVLQAPAAYLVHLASTSAIMTGGLLWLSVLMFLASLSTSYGTLIWIAAIGGVGRATYHPFAVAMLSRIFKKDYLGRAMALHLSGSSLGQMIGPLLVGVLLSHFGWRFPIQIWSMLGLLVGMGLFFFLKYQKEDIYTKNKALSLPFFSRSLGIYILAEGLWGIAQTGLMTFLPLFLVDYRDFSKGKAAAVYGIMALSGTIFRPLIGALMDRMGRRKPVVIGAFIITCLSILCLTTIKTVWILYLSIVLLGIFGSGHAGLADIFMIEMIPSQRREETLGFIFTVRMGIASLSPIIVGFSSEQISLTNSFLILASVPIISASLLFLVEEKPLD